MKVKVGESKDAVVQGEQAKQAAYNGTMDLLAKMQGLTAEQAAQEKQNTAAVVSNTQQEIDAINRKGEALVKVNGVWQQSTANVENHGRVVASFTPAVNGLTEAEKAAAEALKAKAAADAEATASAQANTTATAAQTVATAELGTETKKTTEAIKANTSHTIKMNNGYTKTVEGIRAAKDAMMEMRRATDMTSESMRGFGYIAGQFSTVNYARSGSKSKQGTRGSRERRLLEEYLDAGGTIEDWNSSNSSNTTNNVFNFTQSLSRSDVENIVAEANRQESRA